MPNTTTCAIIALVIIAVTALLIHIDTGIAIASVTGIAGLGGYEMGKNSNP